MSSNLGHIMTLANSIIGVGILAMPYCFLKCGILLSIILLLLSNLITRLSCFYLLKSSIKTRRKTFELLGSYIFGSSGKLMIELCSIGFLLGSCITYFVVIGDLGPQILSKLFGFNQTDSLRTIVMIIVTVFCIIPLCLLRNIESLSFMCITSIIFYFCLVIKIIFEADHKLLTSDWYEQVYWWRPSGVTQCLPIFSMALACQMQLFEIYESLPTQTIDKMNEVVKFGTGICTGVYLMVGFFGYIAFSTQPFSGNILLSFSPSFASDVIKVGFVLSVAVSFPLVIFPCRASLYSLLYHRSHAESAHYIPEHRFKCITITMVLVALIVGILIPSIELVIGLVGSTIGIAICIMFPASCFVKINKKNSTERLLAQFLLVFGLTVMILGTIANLGAIDDKQSNKAMELEPNPIDNVVLPAVIRPISSSEKAVVDKPDDSPFPTDVRNSRRKMPPKLITSKVTADLPNSNDEVVIKEGPQLQPVLDPTLEKLKQPDAPAKEAAPEDIANVEQPINGQIEIERIQPVKAADSSISKDAIEKEEAEMEIVKKDDASKNEPSGKVDDEPGLKKMVNEIQENQKKVLDKMNEIQQKMEDIEQRQRNDQDGSSKEDMQSLKDQISNVQNDVQKQKTNEQSSNVHSANEQNANVPIPNAPSLNMTNNEKQPPVGENSAKAAIPISELLTSKLKQSAEVKPIAVVSPPKVIIDKGDQAPPANDANNVGGRDLLNANTPVEAKETQNL